MVIVCYTPAIMLILNFKSSNFISLPVLCLRWSNKQILNRYFKTWSGGLICYTASCVILSIIGPRNSCRWPMNYDISSVCSFVHFVSYSVCYLSAVRQCADHSLTNSYKFHISRSLWPFFSGPLNKWRLFYWYNQFWEVGTCVLDTLQLIL